MVASNVAKGAVLPFASAAKAAFYLRICADWLYWDAVDILEYGTYAANVLNVTNKAKHVYNFTPKSTDKQNCLLSSLTPSFSHISEQRPTDNEMTDCLYKMIFHLYYC